MYTVDLDDYKTTLVSHLGSDWEAAKANIDIAQRRQKQYYDKKSRETSFHVGDCVLVYIPSEVKGRDWKLSRLFHGPYRIVSLTDSNAEVQLLDMEDPIFVSLDRVRMCPNELSNDTCWTGRSKKRAKRRKLCTWLIQDGTNATACTVGPVTRSMTRDSN